MSADEFVLLDDCRAGAKVRSHYFYGEVTHIRCDDPAKLEDAFAEIARYQQQGHYCVGFCAYECGDALRAQIASTQSDFPLLHFAVFSEHELLSADDVSRLLADKTANDSEAFVYDKHCQLSRDDYVATIDTIKQYIRDGYTYQVNFTTQYAFQVHGNPLALYNKLRQEQVVSYAAMMHFADYDVLSLSPELFFAKEGSRLIAKPMKGTMPRSADTYSDRANANFLTQDPKSCAENLMIVDLLRNDLGKIAKTGSVKVPALFDIESYQTVHQMVSTVTAEVDPQLSLFAIMKALFPCGSITGAPKKKTMEIIRALEQRSRKMYTGAIGYVTPDNDMCFNVAIRTLLLQDGHAELGVGGGIVYDSDPLAEFQEMQLKTRFTHKMNADLQLFETILYDAGYQQLDAHLQRLQRSADCFAFACNSQLIQFRLQQLAQQLDDKQRYKVKCILWSDGMVDLRPSLLPPVCDRPWQVVLYKDGHVDSHNIMLQHKSTAPSVRDFYDSVRRTYQQQGYDEIIFMNEKHQLTEGAISNLFIVKAGQWYTPAVSCGLLPGVKRAQVIIDKSVQEVELDEQDLLTADEVWLSNAVRGLHRVEPIK